MVFITTRALKMEIYENIDILSPIYIYIYIYLYIYLSIYLSFSLKQSYMNPIVYL